MQRVWQGMGLSILLSACAPVALETQVVPVFIDTSDCLSEVAFDYRFRVTRRSGAESWSVRATRDELWLEVSQRNADAAVLHVRTLPAPETQAILAACGL